MGTVLIILAHHEHRSWFGIKKIRLISYPLYLWHWPIISLTCIYLGGRPNNIILIMLLFISFVLAYLTYKYIEPIRFKKSPKITPTLIAISVIVALSGRYIYKHQGLPDRSNLAYLKDLKIQFFRTPVKDNTCEVYSQEFLNKKGEFYFCRASIQNRKKKLALIGDSHAHVMFPGIKSLAAKYGYDVVLLANTSCPPLINFEWGRNPKEVETCQNSIAQILKIIRKDKEIDTVVIATRGPVYIHGEVKGKFD